MNRGRDQRLAVGRLRRSAFPLDPKVGGLSGGQPGFLAVNAWFSGQDARLIVLTNDQTTDARDHRPRRQASPSPVHRPRHNARAVGRLHRDQPALLGQTRLRHHRPGRLAGDPGEAGEAGEADGRR